MDLNLARTFVRVAEAESFTAAGRAARVPTSSISRAIARLERDLGAKLFNRTTRSTSLTPAGRAFLEHARRALDELEEGERRVGELLGQPRGEVRLTVPINLDDGFLARQLTSFVQLHPGVNVTIVPTERIVDFDEEGFDLALRAEQRFAGAPLQMTELGRFFAWVVAAPAYVARRGRPAQPEDLASHDCVAMWPIQGLSKWPLQGPRELTVQVRGPTAADDMHFARQLIEAGAGIGTYIFAPGARVTVGSKFVRVLPEYIVRGPSLYLATAARKTLPLRVKLLRDFLVRAYAEAARARGG